MEVNGGCGIAENGAMVRIDVFRENGKYYFVPVYTADVVKKVLPNKAATSSKRYEEWKEVDDKDFIFSLYSNDLVHVKRKNIPITYIAGGNSTLNEMYVYYKSADISTGSITGIAHDNSYKFRSLGLQRLELIEKCQVDVLGNVSVIRHENRMGFE